MDDTSIAALLRSADSFQIAIPDAQKTLGDINHSVAVGRPYP